MNMVAVKCNGEDGDGYGDGEGSLLVKMMGAVFIRVLELLLM